MGRVGNADVGGPYEGLDARGKVAAILTDSEYGYLNRYLSPGFEI